MGVGMSIIIDESHFDERAYMVDNNPNFVRLVCGACGMVAVAPIHSVVVDCPECEEGEGSMVLAIDHQNN